MKMQGCFEAWPEGPQEPILPPLPCGARLGFSSLASKPHVSVPYLLWALVEDAWRGPWGT